MDITLLKAHAERAPWHLRSLMRNFLKHPTERNACYALGYTEAVERCRALSHDDAGYWRAFIAHYEANKERTGQAWDILVELP